MSQGHHALRLLLGVSGLFYLVLAAGFIGHWPWVLNLWPWPDAYGSGIEGLSSLFMASVCAAIAAPVLWIAITGELAAAKGGGVNLGVVFGAATGYLLLDYASSANQRSLVAAMVCGLLCTASLWGAWLASRIPLRDRRATPIPVMVAFGIFSVILLVVGSLLVSRTSHVLPWPVSDAASVLYGWVFLGASVYFGMALLDARWSHAVGPLLGFLAYDLVLVGPFITYLQDVPPVFRNSLLIYTTVVVSSGLLAVYYLLVRPSSRLRMPGPQPVAAPLRRHGPVYGREARR